MSKRLDKLRKKVDARRREIDTTKKKRERHDIPMMMNRHEEAREDPDFYVYSDQTKQSHQGRENRQRDFFLFRAMVAVCLFLLIAIMFRSAPAQFDGARQLVVQAYESEFQFAAVANWYEDQFGRPLALLPIEQDIALGDPNEEVEMVYAMPTAGKISENFQQNGSGILVETGMDAEVESVKAGYVISVGEGAAGVGKSVVVQHYDGSESIYGMLDQIAVNMYDHIQTGAKIGTVSTNAEVEKGIFYFALRQDNRYIDPSDVIHFD